MMCSGSSRASSTVLSVDLSSTRMISSTQSTGIPATVASSVRAALRAGMTTTTFLSTLWATGVDPRMRPCPVRRLGSSLRAFPKSGHRAPVRAPQLTQQPELLLDLGEQLAVHERAWKLVGDREAGARDLVGCARHEDEA